LVFEFSRRKKLSTTEPKAKKAKTEKKVKKGKDPGQNPKFLSIKHE
jgi:hypothetical protein